MDDDVFRLIALLMWCAGTGISLTVVGLVIWVLIKLIMIL